MTHDKIDGMSPGNYPKYLVSTQSYQHEYATGVDVPTQFGYLVETDFHGFQRLLKISTPTDSPFGERIKTGLRGLCMHNGEVYVGSWNAVHRINYDTFELIETFSHPLMADVHGVYADDQGLWVTSSLVDSLLHFDHRQNLLGVLSLSNTKLYPPNLREPVDLTKDYRLRGKEFDGFRSFHANHVIPFDKDRLLLTGRGAEYNNGRVLMVERDLSKFTVWFKGLRGPHDGIFLDHDYFATTETDSASVAIIRVRGFLGPRLAKRIHLPVGEIKFWTRGLAIAKDGSLLVGRSVWKGDDRKASVINISMNGETLAEYELNIADYPECRIFQIIPAAI